MFMYHKILTKTDTFTDIFMTTNPLKTKGRLKSYISVLQTTIQLASELILQFFSRKFECSQKTLCFEYCL